MLCKICRVHGGDYEECRLLGYKDPVRTSQETHYVSATEPSQLMLCKMLSRQWLGRMPSSGMWCLWLLLRTDVSEKHIATIIKETRICEVGANLALTSNRCSLRRNTIYYFWLWRSCVLPKRRFLHESHGVRSQKTTFFIVTAVKTWNLT
jgi:hypothetical protein